MTGWQVIPYRLPLATPYRWAKGVQTERVGALVEYEGGWGEIAYPPHEPFDPRPVMQAVESVAWTTGGSDAMRGAVRASSMHPRIRCGLTSALWCHDAAASGTPLAGALGVAHDRAPRRSVGVNTLLTAADPGGVAAQSMERAALGFTTFKLKIGTDHSADVRRIEALRDAQPHATIRLDANGAWAPDVAASHLQDVAAFDIEYIEQPVQPKEAETLRRLHASSIVRIALDESSTDAATIEANLADGQGDVIIIKPQRVGGADEAIACIQATEDAGALPVVTNSLETSVGVHVALHIASLLRADVACGLATSHYLAKDVAPAPGIELGRMQVPTTPGLGITPELPT